MFDESTAMDIEDNSEAAALQRKLSNKRLKMAKTICKNIVNLYNKHELNEFNVFIDQQLASDFVYHDDSKSNIHSLTGTPNVQIHIEGLDAFKTFVKSHFYGVPDGVMVIERVRIRDNGMVVLLETAYYGTLVKDVVLPGVGCNMNIDTVSNNYNDVVGRSFGHCSSVKFNLNNEQKINRIDISPSER